MFGRRKKPPPRIDVLPGVCDLEDSFAGIAITGAPGGGKTATVARAIRRNLLRPGLRRHRHVCKTWGVRAAPA